jgi:AraC family transcriptional regulator of arabinose operon
MTGPIHPEEADELSVTGLGILWVRQLGYTTDRPHGLDQYLLLRFYTPMLVRTAAGVVHGEPGDCLLYEPMFPQWFTGRGVGYIDDWIHITGPAVPELVGSYRVPVNTLFRPRELDFFSPTLEAINRERHRRELFWQHSVRLLVETLLFRLGRLVNEQQRFDLRPTDFARADVLRSVRMQVHEQLGERWTVARMAELAHVSASRFAVLYKKLFGVTPIEDLIDARLARARALLTNAGLSVSEAAAQTGFASLCYFSRLFRRRVGTTARDYCRRDRQEGDSTEPVGDEPPRGLAQAVPVSAVRRAAQRGRRQHQVRRTPP